MNQQRKLSRHNSRQSSIAETASVGSTKSGKSNGSGNTEHTSSQQSIRKANGLGKSHASQDSSDSGTGSQPANILNVAEMILHGVADNEILDIWLRSINCEEFVANFIDAGYDMPTISRITPQDLTAIGITEPSKRLKILNEIKKLNLHDGIPTFRPASLLHWLSLIRLDSYYYKSLCDQQIDTIEKMCQLTWEDFEELGISKLGHQKRFQLAIERLKSLDTDTNNSKAKTISEPIYDTNPSQILLVASAENHSMNGPIINKQPSTGELSSTGSGSMHSVYSANSAHYQPTYGTITDTQQLSMMNPMIPNGNQSISPPQQQQQQQQQHNQQPKQQYPHPHHQQQQHQVIYSQPPPPIIYQQPSQLLSNARQQPAYQQHSQQRPPWSIQTMPSQFNGSTTLSNNTMKMINMNNMNTMNTMNPHQNRQSIGQFPFSALANLPKHQQQLLQQSSIYATLSRQPGRVKQPPPPVPIRTNSLKTNSLTDEANGQQNQPTNSCSNNGNSISSSQSQLYNFHHATSTSSLFRAGTGVGTLNRNQFNSQTMLTQNKSFSGNATAFTDCNATTGKDDDFPPPPSPLSITDSDEHEVVSINSDSNFSDIQRGLMTFRVGI